MQYKKNKDKLQFLNQINKELRYTYWNTASEKPKGIKAEQATGKLLNEQFINISRFKDIEEFYQKVPDAGKCHTTEFCTKLKGGVLCLGLHWR